MVVRRIVAALGWYAFVGALASLLGWATDTPWLTDWDRNGISIQPNATVAAMSAAAGLLSLGWGHRPLATVLGAFVAFLGASVLFQHVSRVDLGIDTLLMFGRTWGRTSVASPGRMGPPGAISWTIIGVALVITSRAENPARSATAPFLGLATAGIASLSLVGYLYGAKSLYSVPSATAIALQTATFIFAISLGLVIASYERDPMRLLFDAGPAGALLRRIVPAIVLIPIGIGFIRVLAERAGVFESAFGSALRTLIEIGLFVSLLWITGNTIRREAKQRSDAHAALHASEQSLRDADRHKDEFLAILAHELRNPLAPIRSAVELIKLDVPADSRLAKCRNVIDRQVSHMARLLDDLLDAGRIANGKFELRRQTVELSTVIHAAIETCTPLIESAKHELTVRLPPDPVLIDGDPIRLAQIFGNLLNNACKYTTPSGHLWLWVRLYGDAVVVTVRDTGVGIPASNLTKIFDMFSPGSSLAGKARSGLGIGLHLAHSLVEMHGGTMTAHSEGLGTGSEFVVRLPVLADDKRSPGVSEDESGLVPAPARRVLVVDDNEDAAVGLAMLLQAVGNETTVAQDGLEALEKASAYHPDVVLLDIGLPGMSGYDVCRTLRDQTSDYRPVIIALTGWGQDEDRRRSSAAGFDGHLVKPVSLEALQKVLAH
jgi:signal transduction histidine kinase/CheY-like chemotaxis protein